MLSSASPAYDDAALLNRMAQDDERAFKELYQRYRESLLGYVYNRLRDREQSREIVQDVFISLWERRGKVEIVSLKSYLYTSVKFKIISTLRDKRVRAEFAESFYALHPERLHHDNSTVEQQNIRDIEGIVEQSLATLPEHYRKAYQLSRKENLSIAEIAQRMNISKEAVANYLSFALKHLRGSLGEFMVVVLILRELQ